MNIHTFCFNGFQVNTYVLWDDTKECIIVDAACYQEFERHELKAFITQNELKPVKSVSTHCHVDHILGNSFVYDSFGLKPIIHEDGMPFLKNAKEHAWSFGFDIDKVIIPEDFVDEGDEIVFGKSSLKIVYTPGHADGSICLVSEADSFVITGDVLFSGSIGRTDLPTGDFELLIENIRSKLLTLASDYVVYPGHGPSSTIGQESKFNPFLIS